MSIISTENDRKLVEELAKNFSYEVLEDFLIRKKFTIKLEKISLEDKLIDEYGIKKLQLFATKQVDQQPLHVYTLELTTTLTDRSSKKRQFDIAKRLLNTHLVNTGLFIFHDNLKNFRFSLVYKIPIGTKVKYSYYKRYTFYVSPNLPNKTFILQIGQCEFDTFENIKSAFSVEPVTKQFYGELQAWYYYAMNQAKFPEDYKYSDDPEKDREIRTALNLIRLITRLIFIWFLKEKELIPEILFDEKQLKNIVKDFGKGHNYYNAILQNLFFATLNRPINERGWAYDKGYPANKSNFGVKSLYRYEDKFLIQSNEFMKLFSTIPFINGGLFDCLDKDKVYIDGFSRNEKKQAKISDELFFSSEEKIVDLSKYGLSKNVKVRGLIDILKSYNFTTDEATPIDQEIALDPELLGKVFENLLASYNPETATTARKATGSYYTPREIVDYMVEESLREYLKTEVPEAQDILDDLFSYSVEELDISKDLRLKLIQAIDQIKIIDPACGSGAFPMGILQKLVHLLQKLDPDNKYWYELQYERSIKASEEVFKEKDKAEREEMLKEINEAFDESINYPDYARKLYLIENCIYGVDIQPIAIQISKLRFFISLVIDQKVDKEKENYGIRPLPNLETKFVSANTLIGLERPKQLQLRNQEIEKKEKELKDIRHRYFTAKTRAGKLKLQEKDREIRKQIAKLLINNGYPDDTAHKIASFDLFDQNASTDWFDPEWMFGVVDGFDIVIGNPPYVRQENIEDKESIIDSISKCFFKEGRSLVEINKRSDLYIYFYYKGLSFLKNSGVLCYISSNSWLDVGFGIEFQKFLLKYMHPLMIVDNTAERNFEADINTVIVFIKIPEKISLDDIIKFVVFKKSFDEILNSDILKIVRQTYYKVINENFRVIPKTRKELWIEGIETEDDEVKEKYLWNYKYIGNKWGGKYLRAPEIFFKILEKGKDKLVKLGDIAEVISGVITGNNKSYYIPFFSDFNEDEYIPAFKSSKDIDKIICQKSDVKWLLRKESRFLSKVADFLIGDTKNDRFVVHFNRDKIIFEHKFIGINFKPESNNKCNILMLNSTLFILFTEMFGKSNLGEGALYLVPFDIKKMIVINPKFLEIPISESIEKFLTRPILSIFEELGFQKCNKKKCNHPEHPYEYVNPEEVSFDRIMPDRRELDKIIFETLNLTEEEQLEVYKAVIELVKNRILKAKSR
jgi:adenine-specific DNA-methyltransferase